MAGVSGFHLALAIVMAAFAAMLATARVRWPDAGLPRRAAEVLVAGGAPLLFGLALVPGFLAVAERGLAPLIAGHAWYTTIDEYAPLLFGGWNPLREECSAVLKMFGLPPAAMPLCVPAFLRAWRRRPGERTALAFLAYWGTLFLALTLIRARFALYVSVPAALWIGLAGRELSH